MSIRTTTKEIRENFPKILSVGYCEMANLLYTKKPIAHTEGIYGWNYDVYVINNIAICTGYRGMPKSTIKCNHEIINKYEYKAKSKITFNASRNEEILAKLLDKMIKELQGGNKQ